VWQIIISLAIGVAGSIIAYLVIIFISNRWQAFILAKTEIGKLKGQWSAEWFIGIGTERKSYIQDRVDIQKVKGSKIIGKGEDIKGTYRLNGNYSLPNIITLTYKYEKSRNFLTGVVILKIDPLGKRCEGIWYGFLKEGIINGGDVIWSQL